MLAEARRIADLGYTEIQLLGQNVNSYRDPEGKLSFAELLAAVGQVSGIRRVRFTTSHPRDFTRDIVEAIDAVPNALRSRASARAVRLVARAQDDGPRVHAGLVPRAHRWIKAARRPISLSTDIIVGFPGETADDFIQTMDLLARSSTIASSVSSTRPGPTRRR